MTPLTIPHRTTCRRRGRHPRRVRSTHPVCCSPDRKGASTELPMTERGERSYEIVVEGVAGPAVQSAFDDCHLDVRAAATRLVPLMHDDAAFYAVLESPATLVSPCSKCVGSTDQRQQPSAVDQLGRPDCLSIRCAATRRARPVALILVAAVANLNLAGRQRRAARHRQGVRLVADDARPHRGRLLARPGRVGALPRRARRPLRPQADADRSACRCRSRRACSPRSRRTTASSFVARLLGGLSAGMAYPTTLALITALWSGQPRTQSRSRCGRRSAARSPRSGRWSPACCSSTSGGDRCSSSRCRSPSVALVLALVLVPAHVNEDDRPGRQPRRRPLRGAGRRADPRDQLRAGARQGRARARRSASIALAAGVVGFVIRQRRARNPALRPRRRGAADVLGGGVRGHHRVRLADGRDVHRPAVPAERARLLDVRRRRARSCRPRLMVSSRRVGEARRGHRAHG